MTTDDPILQCTDLSVKYPGNIHAVQGISFHINAGECVALVGESGCGKTTIARSILGLLPEGATNKGSITICNKEVIGASPAFLQSMRGLTVGFVAQDPFKACNPLDKIKEHVAEAWRAHNFKSPFNRILNLLHKLKIKNVSSMVKSFPHQWSGGMLQRATIAAAIAHRPPLVVADEPTSALDADIADTTLSLLKQSKAAILLISHDITLVSRHADRVAIIYAGRIVELTNTRSLRLHPRHPYTVGLFNAMPQAGKGLPQPLPGTPPKLSITINGCAFAPRCGSQQPSCLTKIPELYNGLACPVVISPKWKNKPCSPDGNKSSKVLFQKHITSNRPVLVAEAHNIAKVYGKGKKSVLAISKASLQVRKGEVIGICGASGCGKSTFLRILSTIDYPDCGVIYLNGQPVNQRIKRLNHGCSRKGYVMPVFQDPVGSLDPRWPIWRTIAEPLTAKQSLSRATRQSIAAEKLSEVGLGNIDINARPYELSVGQCQRISILRAIIANPALLVADEPTSALDASIAATVLSLFADIARRGTSIVIVSHDKAILNAICHRVLTMKDGVL